MLTIETGAPVKVKNILYLTDFSKPSEAALPFAVTLGRGCGAKVHALHVDSCSLRFCDARVDSYSDRNRGRKCAGRNAAG